MNLSPDFFTRPTLRSFLAPILGVAILLCGSFATMGQTKSQTPASVRKVRKMDPLEISVQSVKKKLDDKDDQFLLLDCREQKEYDHVHIDGATLMPMSSITENVDKIDAHRDKPIIVYCHHGGRSMRVTKWLKENGFQDVKSMAGGIDEWAVEIDPDKPRY